LATIWFVNYLVWQLFGLATSVWQLLGLATIWFGNYLVRQLFGSATFWFSNYLIQQLFSLPTFGLATIHLVRRLFGLTAI